MKKLVPYLAAAFVGGILKGALLGDADAECDKDYQKQLKLEISGVSYAMGYAQANCDIVAGNRADELKAYFQKHGDRPISLPAFDLPNGEKAVCVIDKNGVNAEIRHATVHGYDDVAAPPPPR